MSDLLVGYSDPDSDSLSVIGLTATNGQLVADGTTKYRFTPNKDFSGTVNLAYTVTDGKGSNISATNTITINAVNDLPVRTAGDVATLYLLEDEAITSMGLAGVTYSQGGGIDETTTNTTKQTLEYKVKTLPAATFGVVYKSDGTTAVGATEVLTLAELQGLKFKPTTNAYGTANFEYTVTDGGTRPARTPADPQSITETLTINLKAFNDTPVLPTGANIVKFENADGSERKATEDTAFTFELADLIKRVTDPDIIPGGSPTNPEGDVLAVLPANVSATNGSITYNATTQKWTFTPIHTLLVMQELIT